MTMFNIEKLNVLIADHRAIVRAGIRSAIHRLEAHEVRIHEAESYQDAVEILQHTPGLDLVIFCLKSPDIEDTLLLETIRNRFHSVHAIAFSDEGDEQRMFHAYDHGIKGCVMQTSTPEVICSAIMLVLAGGLFVPQHVLELARSAARHRGRSRARGTREVFLRDEETALPDGLTVRQTEILSLIQQGKSNKEISRELGISLGTAKNHVAAVLKGLSVRNRAQAVGAAFHASRVGFPLDYLSTSVAVQAARER